MSDLILERLRSALGEATRRRIEAKESRDKSAIEISGEISRKWGVTNYSSIVLGTLTQDMTWIDMWSAQTPVGQGSTIK